MEHVHKAFNNLRPNLQYNIADIIDELKKQRDSLVGELEKATETMRGAIAKNDLVSGLFPDSTQLMRYHNAFLIAKGMQACGMTTITLNSKKDMVGQILSNYRHPFSGYDAFNKKVEKDKLILRHST